MRAVTSPTGRPQLDAVLLLSAAEIDGADVPEEEKDRSYTQAAIDDLDSQIESGELFGLVHAATGVLEFDYARHDSAEDFCRLKARRCTAMDRVFILAYCFAIP